MGICVANGRFGRHVAFPVKDNLRAAIAITDGVGAPAHQAVGVPANASVDRDFWNEAIALGKLWQCKGPQCRARELQRFEPGRRVSWRKMPDQLRASFLRSFRDLF